MKKKNWYRSLSLADDAYVAEAHPDRAVRPHRRGRIISLVAACVCLALVGCCLWLFIPFDTTPPDVSAYEDNEYYEIIKKLRDLTYQPPAYKNNAEGLWEGLGDIFAEDNAAVDDSAPEKDYATGSNGAGTGANQEYLEITDNQVDGIVEADRIKRSNTHIYYLDGKTLRVFTIAGEASEEVGSYRFYDDDRDRGDYENQWEFFLSDDCETVTVVTQCYGKLGQRTGRYVQLISLDVSDPSQITKKEEFSMTGEYMSSRKANGSILLLTEFVIDKNNLDFSDESTFVPQISKGNGVYSMPASAIVAPDQLNSTRYTVVLKLDENTLDLKGTAAYLSYSEDAYVSEDHVFLTRVYADVKENDDGTTTRNSMTEISCLTYGGEIFEKKGSVIVRGYVKDQWSMDEYEGILRVFTTTNATTIRATYSGGDMVSAEILQTATGQSNASLYCIDLATFEVIASKIDFAPPREEIQSVRFEGTMAYACTSIEMSDPVFFFDLSDLDNITCKETGTIEGFSTSLINLGNGYLLGIGRGGNWDSFKVEVYEETADGVRSVDSYELDRTDYSSEYKSYYVDRQNQLVGIGVLIYGNSTGNGNDYDQDVTTGSRYILLHFDEYELVELINTPLAGEPETMRGVCIDGYMYMFGQNDFRVTRVLADA